MKNIETQINLLRDFDFKTATINDIEFFLPQLGMNGENSFELPNELSKYFDMGIRFWQYPNQFSGFLKKITELEINSYLEVGCRWGGTFIIISELLKNINNDCQLYACDIIKKSSILEEYSKHQTYEYINNSSNSTDFLNSLPEKIDLIFIDGDHSYNAVKQDFNNLKNKAKYIVLHDIVNDSCPDVVKFWNEIKNEYKNSWEFTQQYDSVNGNFLGIGLIEL